MCRGDRFGGFADIAREKLIFILLRNAGPERLTENDGKRRKLEWPPDRIVKLV